MERAIPAGVRRTSRLLKRRAIHAGLIMTPGLIGKPRKSPPVGKPRVPSQGSVVAVSPPGSVVAVPPPGSVIAPPSAAVAMPPTMSDRLCTINTTLIDRIDVSLCYGRQSPCWLGQEQASGNTRCCKKAQLLRSHHLSVPFFIAENAMVVSAPSRCALAENKSPLPAKPGK